MALKDWVYLKPAEIGRVRKTLCSGNVIVDTTFHDLLKRLVAEYDDIKGSPAMFAEYVEPTAVVVKPVEVVPVKDSDIAG